MSNHTLREHFYFTNIERINMDFGKAIEAVKRGEKVSRDGWNGKGMFIFIGLPRVEVNIELDGQVTSMDAASVFLCDYSGPVLCMKSAHGTIVVGWLASQTDMLAEDWNIFYTSEPK